MIITTAKAMKEVLYVRRSNLMNFDGDRAEMRDNQRHITAEEFVASRVVLFGLCGLIWLYEVYSLHEDVLFLQSGVMCEGFFFFAAG